jgi:hypothetical protein
VGVDQTQAAQRAFAQRIISQLRDDQPFFIADDDVFDQPGPVDQNADLAADIGGKLYEAGTEFMGTEFGRRDAPAVEALQSLDLTRF